MKNNKGITLLSLMIMIVILFILASIAFSTGISTIRYTKYANAKYEMELVKAKVDELYEEYKDSEDKETFLSQYGIEITNPSEEESKTNESEYYDAIVTLENAGISNFQQYRYFRANYIVEDLGVDGISYDFLIDIANRDVILVNGIYYKGITYYTLEDFNINNVDVKLEAKLRLEEKNGTKQIVLYIVNGNVLSYDYWVHIDGELVTTEDGIKGQGEKIVLNDKIEEYLKIGIDEIYVTVSYSDLEVLSNTLRDIEGTELRPKNVEANAYTTTFPTEYGTIDVIWLSGTTNTVTSTPNAPILTSNGESMTPVTWTYTEGTDGADGTWTEDETAQSTWYSYNAVSSRNEDGSTVDNLTSMWANAKTDNGSYFVWIPRYAYRITYYESADSTTPTGYYDGWGMWKAEDGTVKYALDEGVETVDYNGMKYIVHPAFMDDSNTGSDETQNSGDDYTHGGWSENLPGFWFAKFEMSGATGITLQSTYGTTSIRTQEIGVQYTSGREATYGYTGTTDTEDEKTSFMSSHMMKNSEWGAVAYLTQSQYGRNGNEIDINNSSDYITGNGGGSTSASDEPGTTNAYNTTTGAKASTTGNVYGIYDMSGGAWERVAAFNSVDSSGYFSTYGWTEATGLTVDSSSTKYATKYTNTSDRGSSPTAEYTAVYACGKVGDATKEVNTGGRYPGISTTYCYNWFSNYAYLVHPGQPFFARGGHYTDETVDSKNNKYKAGVFSSNCYAGSYTSYHTFRTVLCP